MHARYILLGKPWKFDKNVIHDGFKNRYSFVKDNQKVTLATLTPKQVYEDLLKLEKESEAESSKRKECKKERNKSENASDNSRKGEIQKEKKKATREKNKGKSEFVHKRE